MLGCCERGNLELSDFLVNLGNIFAEGGAPPPRSLVPSEYYSQHPAINAPATNIRGMNTIIIAIINICVIVSGQE